MRCENPRCGIDLHTDHVTLITTKHVRRFCSVECLSESAHLHEDLIALSVGLKKKE